MSITIVLEDDLEAHLLDVEELVDVERERARPCSKSPLLGCNHYCDDYDDDDLNTVMIRG